MSDEKINPLTHNEHGKPLYPKWVHIKDEKTGKTNSQIVQDAAEEETVAGKRVRPDSWKNK